MLPGFIWKTLNFLGSITMLLLIFWLAWGYLGPRKPEVSEVRQHMATNIVPEITEYVRMHGKGVRTAVLAHLENDPSDQVTNALRKGLERSGILDLHDRSFIEKLRELLHLRHPSYGELGDALMLAKTRDTDAVLFGKVNSFEETPSGAIIDIELTLASLNTSQPVFTKRFAKTENSIFSDGVHVAAASGITYSLQQFLYWALLALFLPIFSIQFLRNMLRKESNRMNGSVLALYTVIDAIFAVLLLGGAFSSWLFIVICAVLVIAAFYYNTWIMTFALRLED